MLLRRVSLTTLVHKTQSSNSHQYRPSKDSSEAMSDPNVLKEILAQAPQNSHLGSKMITSAEVDIGDMIEKSGCNDKYSELEECLGEHDRDWRKCQVEVPNS
jgi:hypothetical protein